MYIEKGIGNFNSRDGSIVFLKTPLNNSDYAVTVEPTENTNGALGEIFIAHKSDSYFEVRNTGSFKGTFNYIVVG